MYPDCSDSLLCIKSRTLHNTDPSSWEDFKIKTGNIGTQNLFWGEVSCPGNKELRTDGEVASEGEKWYLR